MKKLASILALVACGIAAAGVVQYSPTPGEAFASADGGALKSVQVFSATSGGTVKLERLLAVNAYTNAIAIHSSTSTAFTVVWTNTMHHIVTTNTYDNTKVTPPAWCLPLSSNTVVTISAITNTWPVLKETVTSNETICTGTCTGNGYANTPAGIYIMPGDKLIFTGSAATNGWLRLAIE